MLRIAGRRLSSSLSWRPAAVAAAGAGARSPAPAPPGKTTTARPAGASGHGSPSNIPSSPLPETMSEAEALDMKAVLESKGEVEFKVCTLGKDVTIKQNIVSINMEKKKEHQRKFTPSVIEVLNPPSGLDAFCTASLNIASTKGLAKRRMSN